jgi:hypothetical protein
MQANMTEILNKMQDVANMLRCHAIDSPADSETCYWTFHLEDCAIAIYKDIYDLKRRIEKLGLPT